MSSPPPTHATEERPRDSDRAAEAERPAGTDADRPEEAATERARLRERVNELEAALERKEEELDVVRRQYEAVLQGRNDGPAGRMTWRHPEERWVGEDLAMACRASGEASSQTAEAESGDDGGLLSFLR